MTTWNVLLLILNFVIFILIVAKVVQFNSLYQENLRVQSSIEELVNQNSRLVNVLLDELESKIQEARELLEEKEGINKHVCEEALPTKSAKTRRQAKQWDKMMEIELPQQVAEAGTNKEAVDATDTKVAYMKKMGMSVQDIAQKLNLSQGEIALKLKLHEKKASANKAGSVFK